MNAKKMIRKFPLGSRVLVTLREDGSGSPWKKYATVTGWDTNVHNRVLVRYEGPGGSTEFGITGRIKPSRLKVLEPIGKSQITQMIAQDNGTELVEHPLPAQGDTDDMLGLPSAAQEDPADPVWRATYLNSAGPQEILDRPIDYFVGMVKHATPEQIDAIIGRVAERTFEGVLTPEQAKNLVRFARAIPKKHVMGLWKRLVDDPRLLSVNLTVFDNAGLPAVVIDSIQYPVPAETEKIGCRCGGARCPGASP